MQEKVLVTWDIDGTLMFCGERNKVHGDAIVHAISEMTGVKEKLSYFLKGKPLAGCSDRFIAEQAFIMTKGGFDEAMMNEFMRKAETYFIEHFDGSLTVLPGVETVLQKLSEMPNVTIAICSGNPPEIGWRKLECAKLKDFFKDRIAGWGLQAERADMLKEAISQGERSINGKFDRIIHVGDAPQDAEAAKANGVIGVIVKTSRHGNGAFPEEAIQLENLEIGYNSFMKIVETGKAE